MRAGRKGETWIPQWLAEALAGLGAGNVRDNADATVLHNAFPAWAVWLPHEGRPWTALRPASQRAPAPDLPMIWAQASTAAALADLMRAADAQLAPHPAGPETLPDPQPPQDHGSADE